MEAYQKHKGDSLLGCFAKEQPPRSYKKRLTEDQVKFLEMSFSLEKKLEPQRKVQLAYDLGLHPRQVAIWYQNKRARWKTQRMELDHNTLKVQVESLAADKRRLEKEVARLGREIELARDMLRKNCGIDIQSEDDQCGSSERDNNEAIRRKEEKEDGRSSDRPENGAVSMEDLYACLAGFEGHHHGKLQFYDLF